MTPVCFQGGLLENKDFNIRCNLYDGRHNYDGHLAQVKVCYTVLVHVCN